uniref:PB1-like domain-containing protein n=1 Tax=Tanacetum cinerariifolium TaxID=118510 RepID=A0A6L2LZV6_TANCI|nr:hypothetical protein [Tanacetum cinerariifolium]
MLLCEWMLRSDGHPFDPYAVYSRYPIVFSLEIHHGGELGKAANRLYDGGKVHWFDQIDLDGFLVVKVNHMLAGLGYVNPKMEYWYKMPDKDALLPLSNNNDVLRFVKYVDSEPNATELPSELPNVAEPSELPNVDEPSEVPNVAEVMRVKRVMSDDIDFDVELEDRIEDVEVDMSDFRKYTDEYVEWVGPNEVLVEDTQPVEAEVFEDLDLEDFDSASDPDDIDINKNHKDEMVGRLAVENRRQLWLSKNDKVRVRAQCRGIVPTFSNDGGSQFGPNGPSGSSVKSKLKKTKMAYSQSQNNTKKSGEPKVVEYLASMQWHAFGTWQVMVRNLVYLSHGHMEEVTKSNNINTTRLSRPCRAGKSVTYTTCGQVGHNSRSYKGQRGLIVNQSQASHASASASARPSDARGVEVRLTMKIVNVVLM